MDAIDRDVVVVGAGFAGLRCASRLREAGLRVAVLEARERIGGRTRSESLGGMTVDVGGQWIGRGHERLLALAQAAGATLRPQHVEGAKLLQLSTDTPGRMRRYRGLIPRVSPLALVELELAIRKLNRLAANIDPAAPWAARRAAEWDAQTVASWARRRLRSRGAREVFDIALRAVMTAEPGALSFLQLLFYCASNDGFEALTATTDGAQAWVVDGGMPTLAHWLARDLGEALQLDCPLQGLEQDARGVRLHTTRGCWRARRAVLTQPLPLLAGLDCEPALPARRQRLAAASPMGSVIKAVVAYPRPFWRAQGLSGEAVSHRLPFNTVFDASWPESAGGALVGFIDGAPALDYADHSAAARKQAVLDSLVEYFGPQAAQATGYVDHNWVADPWARGCYTVAMPPGVLASLGPELREPAGAVHFAGTETARRWTGYIEGALESGERAAEEVLAALKHAPAVARA